MDYATFHRRVVEALDDRLDSMPRGTKKAICEQIGVGTTWFSDLRREVKALPMKRLVAVLGILGEHPGEFIYRATWQKGMPKLPDKEQNALDPDLARLLDLASEKVRANDPV